MKSDLESTICFKMIICHYPIKQLGLHWETIPAAHVNHTGVPNKQTALPPEMADLRK